MVFIQSIYRWNNVDWNQGFEAINKVNLKVLRLLDYVFGKRYKGKEDRFIPDIISTVVSHYLKIWEFYILCVLKSKILNVDKEEANSCSILLKKIYLENMPYMGKWLEKQGVFDVSFSTRYLENMDITYEEKKTYIRREFGFRANEVVEDLVKPFEFETVYASNKAIYNDLNRKYNKILLDIPNTTMTSYETKIWETNIAKTIYGAMNFALTDVYDMKSILQKQEFTYDSRSNFFPNEIMPFIPKLYIRRIEKREDHTKVTFMFGVAKTLGIEADDASIKECMKLFLRGKALNWLTDRDSQLAKFIGLEKYEQIVLPESEEVECYYLGMVCRRNYILLWESATNIIDIIHGFREMKKRNELFEKIINHVNYDIVTEYIWKKKYEGSSVSLEEVREVYNQFVVDLIDVWMEENSN